MRRIEYPLLAGDRRAIAPILQTARVVLRVAAMLLIVTGATASTSPKFGGVLHVQMSARIATIDPRQWPTDSLRAAASERVASLIFDRLIRFDDHGMPQAALALSWQHDVQSKRWQFRLRGDVKFADGSPLTAESAALALQQLLGNAFDVSATSDSVVIQADHSLPDFPAQLATGRYFIFHSSSDGTLFGTGPFRVSEWPAGDAPKKVVLTASESCWAGRPFVDRIEVTMGVDPQQQVNAIAFGQADLVELPASEVRRTAERGARTA